MAQVESRGGRVDAPWPTRVPNSYLISPQLCPGPPLLLASTASHSEPGESGAQAWVTGLKQALTHVRYPCRDPEEVYDDVEPTDHSGPGPRSRGDRAGHSARPVC